MAHEPSHHVRSTAFPESAEEGLTPPVRARGSAPAAGLVAPTTPGTETINTLVISPFGLRITTPDTADPVGYRDGAVIRDAHTASGVLAPGSANALKITAEPRMPPIAVTVECRGFNPADTPILFRLQVGYTFCRFGKVDKWVYEPTIERFTAEWQGRAASSAFTLFDPKDANVTFTHGTITDSPVGGHAILSVAAKPPGARNHLVDYAHLLIGGISPDETNARNYIDEALAGRSEHIVRMVNAAFAHESSYIQFKRRHQPGRTMTFGGKQHNYDKTQPDCPVHFDWPVDPPAFPLISYDWGVGITQYTRLSGQPMSAAILWDWRANIAKAINLFMNKLNANFAQGLTWREFARRGWRAYNGGGAHAAVYVERVANSTDGQLVPDEAMPATFNRRAELRSLPSVAVARGEAPEWPQ